MFLCPLQTFGQNTMWYARKQMPNEQAMTGKYRKKGKNLIVIWSYIDIEIIVVYVLKKVNGRELGEN